MLPTVLYLLLQSTSVQTYVLKRITKHFSSEIKSTISVGSIEYKFFNKLSLRNILIKDKNNDTLIYARELTAGIRGLNFKNKSFRLGKVSLKDPVVAFITDSAGQMNLTWYLDLLKKEGDTTQNNGQGAAISIDQIDLDNARFSLINQTGDSGQAKMDFNHLRLSGLNGTMTDLRISNDTTSFNLFNLAFRESSGFNVQRLSGQISLSGQDIHLSSAYINCGTSILNISKFDMKADSADAFKKFTEKVKLDILLDKSTISTRDLAYFIPLSDSLNESIWVSGKILGTISELRGRDIKLSYGNYTTLDCDFDFSGLPKIESAYMYIGVNNLKTNTKDIEHVRLPGNSRFVLPDAIKKVGNISFNGSFTGFTTDFVTYGEIRTSLGNVRTDISLRPEKDNRYRVKGLLTGTGINLGELSGNSEFLGKMSMKANIDGYANSLQKFAGNLTGKIDSIEINRYVYRNVTMDGYFTEKTWDGSINITDKNIKLNLLGLLNFKNELPEFDFTLNISDANLYKLNFDKIDTTASVTLLLTSNFKGNNIDNLDGEIKLLNSNFRKYNNNLELYDFSIRTYKEDAKPVLSLRTDFLDAEIKGYYNFAGLGNLVKSTLVKLMPSQFQEDEKQADLQNNNFTFDINFKNTEKINAFFRTGLSIADKSFLRGSIFADSAIHISGKSDLFTVKNNVFNNLSFNTRIDGSKLTFDLKSSSLNLLGQSELKDFNIGVETIPDNFTFNVDWDNKEKILNKGRLIAHGTVTKNHDGKQHIDIDIDSSRVYSDNNLWKLSKSLVQIDSSSVKINKLAASSNERFYLVDGTISKNPSDTLHLDFKGIDLAPLNYLINKKNAGDTSMVSLDLKGRLNGKILISNVYSNLLLAGNIYIENFSMLASEFGNISIKSDLNSTKKVVNIEAYNNLHNVKMFNVTGTYDPAAKKIDLTAVTSRMPVTFLNPLLKTFASEITGTASGKLTLTGKADNFILQGAIMGENASMKIDYLQSKYTLNDSIRFDKDGIKFNNVKLTDTRGNGAILSGFVNHKNFKDFLVDITVTINSSSFQVLNTLPKDNPLFYGTAYASGVANIKIDQNNFAMDVNITKTGKNTKMYIPLSNRLSVSEYSFISFSDSNKDKKTRGEKAADKAPVQKQIGIDLNMNLTVTPDAEIQIIFDSKTGDVMKGHGSSENLNVNLNRNGDLKISGDYIIEDGEYTFTFGNIFNKPFSVENGGRIMFSGDLKDAEIDLKASYLNLKASLASVLGEEKYNERVRVQPQLNLSGKLFNPIVGFDIYLPDADEETRTMLRNAISTEEELTKQVFALLLMNNFIPTGASSISPSSTASGTSAISSTTFEMFSSQLSNWLSQMLKDVDIGFNIRPGTNALTPQEAQLALSTQVLNDKVILNGNFDVRGNSPAVNSTNQLTGDFDAEIKLTDKLKLKVFNRFNDVYTGLSPYTQGVGIFYKQDFNRFSDLFRSRKKANTDMKKEDETKLKTSEH